MQATEPIAAPVGRVALVFTDVEGSTVLWERQPDLARAALALHDACLRDLAARHAGYEVKTEGDAFMLAFADPISALRWCLDAQQALASLAWPPALGEGLRVRMGGHLGDPEPRPDPRTGRMDYFGPVVNRSARVASAAHGGQILATAELWEAAREGLARDVAAEPLGAHRLKGIDDDVTLVQLLPASLSARRFPAPRALQVTGQRPYRGLGSFGPRDGALFFGREREVASLVARLREERLLTVTGPSGVGKSSLLAAGVAPELPEFEWIFLRPGRAPMATLDAALARHRASPKPLAVVVDQAEELLTATEDPAERRAFATALLGLADAPSARHRVVLSVREDWFGRLAATRPLRGRVSAAVEVVPPPDRDQLREALIAPAAAFGYRYEDDALVDAIVDPVAEKPAAFALLSFCADRLWDLRLPTRVVPWSALRAVGGTGGALAQHADQTVDAMPRAHQEVARALLLALVRPDGTRVSVPADELRSRSGDADAATAVLDALLRARLVVSGESDVELAHEALVEHWDRLRAWMAQDREAQHLRHVLRDAAAEWDRRRRPDDLLWSGELAADARRLGNRLGPLLPVESDFVGATLGSIERQRRRRAGAYAGALAAALAVSAVLLWQWRVSEQARAEAAAAAVEIQELAVTAQVRRAAAKLDEGDPAAALSLLADALEAAEGSDLAPRLEIALDLAWQAVPQPFVAFPAPAEGALAVLPDRIAVGTTLFDPETGAPAGTLEIGETIGSYRWDPARQRLAAVGQRLHLLDADGRVLASTEEPVPAGRIRWSADGLALAVVAPAGVSVYDAELRPTSQLAFPDLLVQDFDPTSGRALVFRNRRARAQVLDASGAPVGPEVKTIAGAERVSAGLVPGGAAVLTAAWGGLSLAGGEDARLQADPRPFADGATPRTIDFVAADEALVTANANELALWVASGRSELQPIRLPGRPEDVALDTVHRRLWTVVSDGDDRVVVGWQLPVAPWHPQLPGGTAAAVDPTGAKTLVRGGATPEGRVFRTFDHATGALGPELVLTYDTPAFGGPDRLVIDHWWGAVPEARLVDATTGEALGAWPYAALSVAPDGRFAVLSPEGTLTVREPASGAPVGPPVTAEARWIGLSTTGLVALTGSAAQIVDATTGERVLELPSDVRSGAFSRDGSTFVADGAGSLRAFDVGSGRIVGTVPLEAHVIALAVSPDGGRVATLDADGLDVWSLADGSRLDGDLAVSSTGVPRLAFTTDGRHVLLSNSDSAIVSVYDAHFGALVGVLGEASAPPPVQPDGTVAPLAPAAPARTPEQWRILADLVGGDVSARRFLELRAASATP
jgi:class 3 adenylate cyclase/WD40 repeat protein